MASISKSIFMYKYHYILIQISLKFIPNGPSDNMAD